jgi:hypothetical protein
MIIENFNRIGRKEQFKNDYPQPYRIESMTKGMQRERILLENLGRLHEIKYVLKCYRDS